MCMYAFSTISLYFPCKQTTVPLSELDCVNDSSLVCRTSVYDITICLDLTSVTCYD